MVHIQMKASGRILLNTLGCYYNVVPYDMILNKSLQLLRRNINQSVNQEKTPHTSPYQASTGVSFVKIFKKINCAITAPHCV